MGPTKIYRVIMELQAPKGVTDLLDPEKWYFMLERFFRLEADAFELAEYDARILKMPKTEIEISEDKRTITFTGNTGPKHRCRIVEETLL